MPVNIFVSSGGSVTQQHGPRISVMTNTSDRFNPHETVSIRLKKDISIDDIIGYDALSSNYVGILQRYINLNYDVLLAYWNDDISTTEMITRLQSIQ